jgi:hypothetical protein
MATRAITLAAKQPTLTRRASEEPSLARRVRVSFRAAEVVAYQGIHDS